MSDGNKRWQWKRVLGEATATGACAAVVATATVALAASAPVSIPIAGFGAFTTLIVSRAVGHTLDDPYDPPIGSAVLYAMTLASFISALLFMLALDHLEGPDAVSNNLALGGLSGWLTGLAISLTDDTRARRGIRGSDEIPEVWPLS